jgi:cytochrome c-type biogenesis protein CcmH
MQPAALRAAADPPSAVRGWGRSVGFAIALALVLGSASAAPADETAAESVWGYALANELMSPWCPGFALPDCSSGYAQELRLWILEQERLGRSEDEVRAAILAKYGEKMLQAPSAEGRGILAYAIPAGLVLAGLAVLVAFLRRQGGPAEWSGVANSGPNAQAIGGAPDAADLARADAELAHFESAND